MDSHLEEVWHSIRKAQVEIAEVKQDLVKVKQDLAAAKKAKNEEQERKLFDLLLSLNNQLNGLQEEKNILLRSQAPSKLCL